MKKFEYRIYSVNPTNVGIDATKHRMKPDKHRLNVQMEEIQKMGREGWEMVGVVSPFGQVGGSVDCFFKRELKDD
ncbi:MAG: DUF4177 domain-containing protein [Firmicutes bacterium]|nr:DUF4177 domain-containing protein [Bacillota bacterium]